MSRQAGGSWAGVRHWTLSEVYVLVNLFEKCANNAFRHF